MVKKSLGFTDNVSFGLTLENLEHLLSSRNLLFSGDVRPKFL